jgi:hypothetical protein
MNMRYRYFNNGLCLAAISPDYVAQPGEVLFPDVASVDELMAAFPNADREALAEVEANRQFHDYMSHIHAQVVALLPPGVTLPHLNWSPEARTAWRERQQLSAA